MGILFWNLPPGPNTLSISAYALYCYKYEIKSSLNQPFGKIHRRQIHTCPAKMLAASKNLLPQSIGVFINADANCHWQQSSVS
jgi:hypothetical protein